MLCSTSNFRILRQNISTNTTISPRAFTLCFTCFFYSTVVPVEAPRFILKFVMLAADNKVMRKNR